MKNIFVSWCIGAKIRAIRGVTGISGYFNASKGAEGLPL